MSLARGLAWARAARHMSVTDLVEGSPRDPAHTYRLVRGDVRDPRTDTLVDLCRVLRVSPTTLLQHSGLWPASVPPADEMDSALLALLPRLEALPAPHKRWALRVVQALAVGAPSAASVAELPRFSGCD